MMRVAVPPRPHWQGLADRLGFRNHTYAGGAYWCEDACYRLSAWEIDRDLRPAIADIWAMCQEIVARASADEEILASLRIPEAAWDALRESWRLRHPSLCTRFDLAYGDAGGGPAKLHDCNGDTPGVLFECAAFQWIWLEDRLEQATLDAGCDQFNRLHEALVAACAALPDDGGIIHFAASSANIEDQVWARYIRDCAHQAGRRTDLLGLEAIGVDDTGSLTDLHGRAIGCLVKAYRWDLLLQEPFGPFLIRASAPRLIEPLWKLVLSSKGLLVWLWRLFPRHPNLLPCWFAGDPCIDAGDRFVEKPLFSIKGRDIRLVDPSLPGGGASTPGPADRDGRIIQALHRLPVCPGPAGDAHASVIGWVVAGKAEGIGVLEADGPIINDRVSRFVPHVVMQ
jgi:glutathionylspermidine synthase